MRVVGWPFSATVARAIAFISLIPTSTAAVNQIPNCLIGSGSRSIRRKPWVKYSSRKAARSCGKFTATEINRLEWRLKAEIALQLGAERVGKPFYCPLPERALPELRES